MASAFLLTAGCAGDSAPVVDRLADGRVVGDDSHVSIQGGHLDTLPLAILHCNRYGKAAQFLRVAVDRSLYACVAKS